MADRYSWQFTKTLLPEMWHLDGYQAFDVADGYSMAVLTSPFSGWVSSVTHTGTGLWTVTLIDLWASITAIHPQLVQAAAGKYAMEVLSFNVATPTIHLACVDTTTGSAADPPAGAGLFLSVWVSNSASL